jgi:hypothetical protein
MNRYLKRTKPPADNDAPGSFLLLIGTITTRPAAPHKLVWSPQQMAISHRLV